MTLKPHPSHTRDHPFPIYLNATAEAQATNNADHDIQSQICRYISIIFYDGAQLRVCCTRINTEIQLCTHTADTLVRVRAYAYTVREYFCSLFRLQVVTALFQNLYINPNILTHRPASLSPFGIGIGYANKI